MLNPTEAAAILGDCPNPYRRAQKLWTRVFRTHQVCGPNDRTAGFASEPHHSV